MGKVTKDSQLTEEEADLLSKAGADIVFQGTHWVEHNVRSYLPGILSFMPDRFKYRLLVSEDGDE